jgi:Mn-containing catalase
MHPFWNLSEGTESQEGRWATGPAPDGMGDLVYLTDPKPLSSDDGSLEQSDPRYHGTPKKPLPAMSTGPNPYKGQATPEELDKKALTKKGQKK